MASLYLNLNVAAVGSTAVMIARMEEFASPTKTLEACDFLSRSIQLVSPNLLLTIFTLVN